MNLSTELGIDLWGSEGELREGEDSIDLELILFPFFIIIWMNCRPVTELSL